MIFRACSASALRRHTFEVEDVVGVVQDALPVRHCTSSSGTIRW